MIMGYGDMPDSLFIFLSPDEGPKEGYSHYRDRNRRQSAVFQNHERSQIHQASSMESDPGTDSDMSTDPSSDDHATEVSADGALRSMNQEDHEHSWSCPRPRPQKLNAKQRNFLDDVEKMLDKSVSSWGSLAERTIRSRYPERRRKAVTQNIHEDDSGGSAEHLTAQHGRYIATKDMRCQE
ncbi:hypothetical protein SISNIDRAFT_470673 [Sistotremastrum niveocremeum HHB9708]|uniref:Uncharacterized protein n=1 Tax=Sistotremastrum niveocremeum HHB9708 TaxID=1314777 RepID=A0A164NJW2_9AGAM|nr:hypothetical protein SISNIDRAFT_470673 [Sistotremastrum niveocremeum HHB9708]